MFRSDQTPPEAYSRPGDHQLQSGSCCQPGLRGDNQRLNPCLQSRMNHRCEARVVIRRNVGNRARLLGLGIQVRVGAADKPEYGGNVPARSEGPKVLARGCWLRLLNTVSREITSKC